MALLSTECLGGMVARRKSLFAAQVVCLVLVALSLYAGRHGLARLPRPSFLQGQSEYRPPVNDSGILPSANLTRYIKSIMDPASTELPRLECPLPDASRYAYLKSASAVSVEIQYFFALDLRECLPLLPRLIGSVVEAIRLLGPEHCALSIIGGNSPDGTDEVLEALRPSLESLTTTYYFHSSSVDPKQGDRIGKLAELRNLALKPLATEPGRFTANTTVVFLNDVAICTEDILELIHQRRFLGADMTCAVDWVYVGPDPTFYDVWIARTLAGDSFFDIPADGSWDSAWNLFWNNQNTRERYSSHVPFQVFSCWDGATAFTAAPLLEGRVSFRAAREGECMQGEPQLFCKDLWYHGHGKIAVVPSIHLEYSDEKGKMIKDLKGYTSRWVTEAGGTDEKIDWETIPPERVKCMPGWENQYWEAWNETQI